MERAACLLFRCTDRVGVIAELVMFFRDSNVSICRFEEYADGQYFFARLEWRGDHPWLTAEDFERGFQAVADSFDDVSFSAHFFEEPQKLGLFSSRGPHALIEAINRCEAGDYPNTEICFLIANSKGIEKYARRHDIPFYYVKTFKDPGRHEAVQLEIIQRHAPDLIGLARYMKILTAGFIDQVGCRIVNIHHSFLPSFVGAGRTRWLASAV